MLATVSMQPIARPASAMTEASTFTLWHRGMTAKTTEMAREEVKSAHSDCAKLQVGGKQVGEGCSPQVKVPSSFSTAGWLGKPACDRKGRRVDEQLSLWLWLVPLAHI